MDDGGAIAIVGFLYQLLNSAASLVRSPLSLLIIEPKGQDALLRGSGGQELIQFKFSAVDDPIEPADLATILVKMNESDPERTARWTLSTTRPLSPTSKKLLDPKFSGDTLGKASPKHIKIIKQYRDHLRYENVGFAQVSDELRNRGNSFGLRDDEIRTGTHEVVGKLMDLVRQHGPGADIGIGSLDESLAGIPRPASLRGVDRSTEMARAINDVSTLDLHGPPLDRVLPRRSLSNLFRSSKPVVVTGPGGCGKTTAVLRSLRDYLVSDSTMGVTLLSDAGQSFEGSVASWRSPHQHKASEPFEVSLERLRIANKGGSGHVVVVALDGIDEQGWKSRVQEVRNLYRESVKPSMSDIQSDRGLKLIVTCRDRRELGEYVLGTGLSAPEQQLDYEEIPLDIFDEEEFLDAWNLWVVGLSAPPAVGARRGSEAMDRGDRASTRNDERVAQALRHPTMFMCFCRLAQAKQGDILQRSFLNGDPGAWAALMSHYLDWFKRKSATRSGIRQDLIRPALSEIAKATQTTTMQLFKQDQHWIQPAVHGGSLSSAEARKLFADALTCGLIQTEAGLYRNPHTGSKQWQWCYDFVRDCLRGDF